MTGERTVPGALGLKTYHTLGSSGWKPDVDNNFFLLSAFAQFTALSITTFLPGLPAQGMVYIVPGSAGSNPNQVAIFDNSQWNYVVPVEGMTGYVADEKRVVRYNGSSWDYLWANTDGAGSTGERNWLRNADWRRATAGTTFTTTGATVADFWVMVINSGNYSSNIFTYAGGTDLPEGTSKYLAFTTSSSSNLTLRQRLPNVRRGNGRSVVVSAYARVSSGAATIAAALTQSFGTGGSANATLTGTAIAQTGSFVRYTWTFALASTSAATIATDGTDYLECAFTFAVTGASTVHFANTMIEGGKFATAWERMPDFIVGGPASSTLNHIAIFTDATGSMLADGGKVLPAGAVVGDTDTQTLSGKTLDTPSLSNVVTHTYNFTTSSGVFGGYNATMNRNTTAVGATDQFSGFKFTATDQGTSSPTAFNAMNASMVLANAANVSSFNSAMIAAVGVSANATNATALQIFLSLFAGTLTNFIGAHVNAPAGVGAVTNKTAILIDNTSGPIVQADVTDASGLGTGALRCSGGASISKKLYVGDALTATGNVAPSADNTYTCGTSGARFSAVWAVNGTIQTSDARDKIIQERVTAERATAIVDSVQPILFKWVVGGYIESREEVAFKLLESDEHDSFREEITYTPKPGSRVHAGFVAQEIKEAMEASGGDFGAWGLEDVADPNSKQFLRPDQLLPILWEALRQTRLDLAAVQAQLRGSG